MNSKAMVVAVSLTLAAGLGAGLAGCRIHVDKGSNGEDKNVQIDTPFGGMHVNTDQTTAADIGLPLYPGAEAVQGHDKNKSADVHMGFGEWQLRVRAASFQTKDSRDQVVAFYEQAMGKKYGDVIVCDHNQAVGTPTVTSEGLSCNDEKNPQVNMDNGYNSRGGGYEVKAGSKRHQHVVGFENSESGQTRFALVLLDLPAIVDKKSDKSD
jgi:hypothetical protein